MHDFQKANIVLFNCRFGDKILYYGYNDDRLYVIVTDQSIEETLQKSLHELMGDHFEIRIQNKLAISELAYTGVPLHGAKFVYINENVDAFANDPFFATTGSLMKTNTDQMVAITARHAFKDRESNSIYVLIDRKVVRLGNQMEQLHNKMEGMEEDIAMIGIEDATRSLVDEKCEKPLIDNLGLATPARIISAHNLEKGDIVHKRGAKTGLTTGIVRDIKTQAVGTFSRKSQVIYIKGRNNKPFAGKGDSGSLVYLQSFSPVENILDVVALVQGRVNVPFPNADIICFPFEEGCNTLYKNIKGIRPLRFIDY